MGVCDVLQSCGTQRLEEERVHPFNLQGALLLLLLGRCLRRLGRLVLWLLLVLELIGVEFDDLVPLLIFKQLFLLLASLDGCELWRGRIVGNASDEALVGPVGHGDRFKHSEQVSAPLDDLAL